MFTDPQKKKKEFKARVVKGNRKYMYLISDNGLEMWLKAFSTRNYEKNREIEKTINSITRWNIGEIEREVEDYEEHCENIATTINWFFHRYGDKNYNTWYQTLLKHVNVLLVQIPDNLRNAKSREVYRIAGEAYRKMLDNFQVDENDPTAFQHRICIEIENEAKQRAENHLKGILQYIKDEERRKDEQAYNMAVAQKKVETDAKLDIIKRNYDTQVTELHQNFEAQLQRVREEFKEKLNRKVQQKYKKDKPAKLEEWKNEFISKQNQFIEEEVSKRLKKQFKETLNRKETINQETINLNALKYEQTIKKIESEYQDYIKKMEIQYDEAVSKLNDKIKFLDNHLKETILDYERLFKEKYEAEIEKRAKILAKEYLQKDFPFE